MFIDYLEVEDNLRMSKRIAERDSVNEMDVELELVEQHEKKNISFSFQTFF